MSSAEGHHFPHSLPRWSSWLHGRDLTGTVFFTSHIISCSAIPFIFLTPSHPIPFLFPCIIFFALSRLPFFFFHFHTPITFYIVPSPLPSLPFFLFHLLHLFFSFFLLPRSPPSLFLLTLPPDLLIPPSQIVTPSTGKLSST